MKKVTKERVPEDETSLRRKAVWFRQASSIAMSVNLGHRTGVYQNMTVHEFERAVDTEDDLVITQVGGKKRGRTRLSRCRSPEGCIACSSGMLPTCSRT